MLINDDTCFVCGQHNPEGLHLEFRYAPDGSKAETTFMPAIKYQGWQGIVHGGIIITLLDETMAKAAVRKGFSVLTGEITAKFKNPAKVMEPLRCEAEIEQVKKKIVYARGTVYTHHGTVVAEATSKMVIIIL
ncbi:MAG: PaaI family thioesterase [Pseudomonadota bacterium]